MEDLLFMNELIRKLLLEKNVIFSLFFQKSHIVIYHLFSYLKTFLKMNVFRTLISFACIHIFRANIRDIAITRMITYDTYINRSELVEKSQTCNYVEYINSSWLACLYHSFYRILFVR